MQTEREQGYSFNVRRHHMSTAKQSTDEQKELAACMQSTDPGYDRHTDATIIDAMSRGDAAMLRDVRAASHPR